MSTIFKMFLLTSCCALFIVLPAIEAIPFAAPVPFPEGEGPDGTKYKTAYRCEGEEMSIACDATETIQVIRANYGRFSIAICNKHGFTDWSVNCMSPRTTRVLQTKCDGRRSCRMSVNSEVFGDPCPGTHKYVEVHYACSPQSTTTTTRRPLPPWFLENGADNLWINPKPIHIESPTTSTKTDDATKASSSPLTSPSTTLTTSTANEQETKSIFSISASSAMAAAAANSATGNRRPILVTGSDAGILVTSSVSPARIPITTPRPTTTTTTATTSTTKKTSTTVVKTTTARPPTTAATSTPTVAFDKKNSGHPVETPVSGPEVEVLVEAEGGHYCPPVLSRGLAWNRTRVGDIAILPCPNGATGLARWSCLDDGRWSANSALAGQQPHPDLSDCKSSAMTNLEAKVRQEDPEDVVVSALSHLTTKLTGRMLGGDLESAVSILRTVANRLQYLLQTQAESFYNKESYMQQVFQNVLRASSNLLAEDNRPMWFDLPSGQRAKTVTSLLLALEENAFLVAQVTNSPEILQETSSSIVMAISILDVDYIDRTNGTSFPRLKVSDSTNAGNGKYSNNNNNVVGGGELDWWTQWPEQNTILLPRQPLVEHSSDGSLTKAVFFAHGQLHQVLRDADVHLGQQQQQQSSSRHVINSLVVSASLGHGRHIQLSSPVRMTLRHLKENLTDPICVFWDYELNAWSDAGCRVVDDAKTISGVTVCECEHLTNFGVLMRHTDANSDGTNASLSNDASSRTGGSTVRILEIVTYVAVGLSLLFLAVIIYRYHGKIHRLLLKFNIGSGGDNEKHGHMDKGIDGCAKSQSFYAGINQLVHVTPVDNNLTTLTTSGAGSPGNGAYKSSDLSRLSHYLARGADLSHFDQEVKDEAESYQSNHHLESNGGHITSNPYDMFRGVSAGQPDGMLATQHLRDTVYMSARLANLTNTLRANSNKKKMVCQAGHAAGSVCQNSPRHDFFQPDEDQAQDDDFVFRAVSPHGHVYWEIDPTRIDKLKADPPVTSSTFQQQHHPHSGDFHLSSMSRQSSSRFSDNYPLIGSSPSKSTTSTSGGDVIGSAETMILVNPFADVQLISINSGSSNGGSPLTSANRPLNDVRFSSLRTNQKTQQQRHLAAAAAAAALNNGGGSPIYFGTRASSARTARIKDMVNTVDQWRQQQQLQQQQQHGSISLTGSLSDGPSLSSVGSSGSNNSCTPVISTSGSSNSTSPTTTTTTSMMEQVQQQVQIKDLRSISGNVKSSDYILAKIQNHVTGRSGSPMNSILNRSSPKQRKV